MNSIDDVIRINLDSKKQGRLYLAGRGYLDGLEFKAKARVKKLRLELLQGILGSDSNTITKGDVNGNLNLGVKKGLIK